ncbi:MAG TPA: hypothetical protein VF382_05485 [Actinomycetota bacterium]
MPYVQRFGRSCLDSHCPHVKLFQLTMTVWLNPHHGHSKNLTVA